MVMVPNFHGFTYQVFIVDALEDVQQQRVWLISSCEKLCEMAECDILYLLKMRLFDRMQHFASGI